LAGDAKDQSTGGVIDCNDCAWSSFGVVLEDRFQCLHDRNGVAIGA
jgi:hypothetical protein